MKSKLFVALTAISLLWMGGCSKKAPGSTALQPGAVSQPTPLENCIALWSSGQPEAAMEKFVALDWNATTLFSAGSPLHYSEAEFVALPAAAREQAMIRILAEAQQLKALARRVADTGRQTLAQGDRTRADQCAGSLQRCGARLDQPKSLQLLRQMGIAVKKMAAGLANSSKPAR